jgi:hypothetical protein
MQISIRTTIIVTVIISSVIVGAVAYSAILFYTANVSIPGTTNPIAITQAELNGVTPLCRLSGTPSVETIDCASTGIVIYYGDNATIDLWVTNSAHHSIPINVTYTIPSGNNLTAVSASSCPSVTGGGCTANGASCQGASPASCIVTTPADTTSPGTVMVAFTFTDSNLPSAPGPTLSVRIYQQP